jgi:hypothetical protein
VRARSQHCHDDHCCADHDGGSNNNHCCADHDGGSNHYDSGPDNNDRGA